MVFGMEIRLDSTTGIIQMFSICLYKPSPYH